jgi:sarcosine oxidase subunit gamma
VADDSVFEVGATMTGHYGAPGSTGVTIAETSFAAAWNVQAGARSPAVSTAARALFGLSLPTVPNTTSREGALTALWIGPASWLLVATDASPLVDFETQRDALNAAGGALFDVSAGRVGWTIAGPQAATVLAKGCPLDFDARVFRDGMCAQSVFGRVNALFYRRSRLPGAPADPSSQVAPPFTRLVARSFARDAWRFVCVSAAQYGYEILHPQPF